MNIAGATHGSLESRGNASIFLLGTLLAATSLSSTSHAALIAQDQFLTGASPAAGQYSTGFVNGQNPTVTGFTNAWEVGGQQGATVLGSGLSYSNGSGTVASAGGSLQSRNGFRVRHFLTTPYGASSSGTIYMSLMLDFAATSAGYNAFEVYQGTNDADRALSVGLANASSTTNFVAFIKGVASPLLLGAASTDTQFFVMKFDFSTSPNADSFTIWRNPSDLASEAGSGAGQTVT